MKFKNYIHGKIKRNLILFVLIILGLLTTSLGFYYNLIRETKTTYHYAFRDSKDKTQSLFFQRNTDRNDDKKVIKSIFTFKKGSILNFTNNEVFYITDDNKFDQIKMYDFETDTSSFLFQNENKEVINDLYLEESNIFALTTKEILVINTQTKDIKRFEIKNLGKFNEFFNKKGNIIYLTFNNCKFLNNKCTREYNEYFSYNIDTSETYNISLSNLTEDIQNNKPYFETNKIYKLGTLKKYENDKGIKNYTIRIFTQF